MTTIEAVERIRYRLQSEPMPIWSSAEVDALLTRIDALNTEIGECERRLRSQADTITEQEMQIKALEKIIDIATGALNTVAGDYPAFDPADYAQDALRRMKETRAALDTALGRGSG